MIRALASALAPLGELIQPGTYRFGTALVQHGRPRAFHTWPAARPIWSATAGRGRTLRFSWLATPDVARKLL